MAELFDLSQLQPGQSPPAKVEMYNYSKDQLTAGIVHLGFGGFHRAHLANYTHMLLQKDFEKAKEWGIIGVGLTKWDLAMRDAMKAQNCLYTLLEKEEHEGDKYENAKIIGSIKDYIFNGDQRKGDREKFVQRLGSDANIKIVTITVTQAGYTLTSPPNLRIDENHPLIKQDLASHSSPCTLVGILCEALRLRRENKLPPFTILSCDNIQHNGDLTKQVVVEFARKLNEELSVWISENCKFPNCMVDRITPRTGEEHKQYIKDNYNIVDKYPVTCEKFIQFIVEDDFSLGRPAWEEVGVQFVKDVTPYEMMKLRLLNASHCAMAVLGDLMGFIYIDDVMCDDLVSRYIRALMDREFEPTLLPVDINLNEYKDELMSRFTNKATKDQIKRVADDGLLTAILHTIVDLRKKYQDKEEAYFDLCALAVAAWIKRAAGGKNTKGNEIDFVHASSKEIVPAAVAGGSDPRPVLKIEAVFGGLAQDETVVKRVEFYLQQFYSSSPEEVLKNTAEKMKF